MAIQITQVYYTVTKYRQNKLNYQDFDSDIDDAFKKDFKFIIQVRHIRGIKYSIFKIKKWVAYYLFFILHFQNFQ